jgi:predicted nucleic acid-binding protein
VIGVIDASLTISWMFKDKQTTRGMELLNQVAQSGALVPTLWGLETANALQMAVKRGRCNSLYRDSVLQRLGLLAIKVDSETDRYAWSTTLRLSDRHRLTVYDAAYLELALRWSLPLASRDLDLVKAARESGVSILPSD